MKNTKNFFSIIGVFSLCFLILSWINGGSEGATNNSKSNSSNKEDIVYLPQVVKAPRISKNFEFAGEKIPINVDTKERLERELTVNSYYHSNTVWALKMSTRYFPMMERILKENGVPDDFKYLAVAESTLLNATSPAGAKGIWQFMPATARELGMEVTTEIDQRYDVEKATKAACVYLKRLYTSDGSWLNAAAAYNVGPGKLKSVMNAQGESSYFDMNLNEETSRYVFRLMALKEIISDPQAFGFYMEEEDFSKPLKIKKQVKVSATVNSWADFAHQHGVTYRLLKYANPWLINEKLTVKDKTYTVNIPELQ